MYMKLVLKNDTNIQIRASVLTRMLVLTFINYISSFYVLLFFWKGMLAFTYKTLMLARVNRMYHINELNERDHVFDI